MNPRRLSYVAALAAAFTIGGAVQSFAEAQAAEPSSPAAGVQVVQEKEAKPDTGRQLEAVPSVSAPVLVQEATPVPGEHTQADGFLTYAFQKFDNGEWALGVVALLAGLGVVLRLYGARLHEWFSTRKGVAITGAASSVLFMVLHSLAASTHVSPATVGKAVAFALVAVVPALLLRQPEADGLGPSGTGDGKGGA